jgi:ATP-dependent Lon protease
MELPMMAIRETVVLPGQMIPFVVGRAASVRALSEAIAGDHRIFLAAQRDASVDHPTADDIFSVGAIANIVQSLKLPDGNMKVLVEGVERATVVAISGDGGFLRAEVRVANVQVAPDPRLDAAVRLVLALCKRNPDLTDFWQALPEDEPGRLADMVAANLPLTFQEKQELLEIFEPLARLIRLAHMMGRQQTDVAISTAVLTRWAESCLAMNRLGELLRQEIEGPNRGQRARDLAGRARRLARHLADELAAYGANIPAAEPRPES